MDTNEKIQVLLLGDVIKMLEEKEKPQDSELCLLLCSSKDYEAFVKKDFLREQSTPEIKALPPQPNDDLRKFLKEYFKKYGRK